MFIFFWSVASSTVSYLRKLYCRRKRRVRVSVRRVYLRATGGPRRVRLMYTVTGTHVHVPILYSYDLCYAMGPGHLTDIRDTQSIVLTRQSFSSMFV